MKEQILSVLRQLRAGLRERLVSPQHLRFSVTGRSVDECLRKLEKEAGLPVGDLSIKGEPMNITSSPIPRSGLIHAIASMTSDEWRKDACRQGYVVGHVFEATGPVRDHLRPGAQLSLLAAIAIELAEKFNFYGSLHVSKDCPGVYRDGVCTTCGDVAP